MEEGTVILMVEDDPNLGYLLKENFKSKGIDIHLCTDGEAGYEAFLNYQFSLCILDVMLPKKDGFTLARDIRRKDDNIPIIFLTAKGMDDDKITGFDIGGDDYVTKPFSAQELLARIKAVLKRSKHNQNGAAANANSSWQLGKFAFSYTDRILSAEGYQKRLSTKEADILKLFAENKNVLIHRRDILTNVWGVDDYFTSKSMDVYLTRLRKLLRDDPALEIQNVHGTGFKLIVH
jgi:DNA-binding response OmpR family regulator